MQSNHVEVEDATVNNDNDRLNEHSEVDAGDRRLLFVKVPFGKHAPIRFIKGCLENEEVKKDTKVVVVTYVVDRVHDQDQNRVKQHIQAIVADDLVVAAREASAEAPLSLHNPRNEHHG